jgi:hypothetical protein
LQPDLSPRVSTRDRSLNGYRPKGRIDDAPLKEMTVPELAQLLDCSIPRAQALIRTGAVRDRKGLNGWVTASAAVEDYLAKRANAATQTAPKKE